MNRYFVLNTALYHWIILNWQCGVMGHGFGAVLSGTVYTSHSTVAPGDDLSVWTTVTHRVHATPRQFIRHCPEAVQSSSRDEFCWWYVWFLRANRKQKQSYMLMTLSNVNKVTALKFTLFYPVEGDSTCCRNAGTYLPKYEQWHCKRWLSANRSASCYSWPLDSVSYIKAVL